MVCLRTVFGPYRANAFLLVAGLLPIYWPAGPQSARHIRAGKAPEGRHIGSKPSVQCFVYAQSSAPTGPTCFSRSAACYQYTGPLGHNPLGPCGPLKPQRGDILVAKHRRASVFKAPAGRHIGSGYLSSFFLPSSSFLIRT